jgi:hypothetical protein
VTLPRGMYVTLSAGKERSNLRAFNRLGQQHRLSLVGRTKQWSGPRRTRDTQPVPGFPIPPITGEICDCNRHGPVREFGPPILARIGSKIDLTCPVRSLRRASAGHKSERCTGSPSKPLVTSKSTLCKPSTWHRAAGNVRVGPPGYAIHIPGEPVPDLRCGRGIGHLNVLDAAGNSKRIAAA